MILLALLAEVASAGVWVRSPESAYLQLGYAHTFSEATFDAGGTRLPMADPTFLGESISPLMAEGRYAGNELAAYAELGLVDHVEAFASLPVRLSQQRWTWAVGDNPDILQSNLGLGDAVLGGRVGTFAGPAAFSAAGSVRVPLYDNQPAALRQEPGNSDFYDDRVPLGEGTIDLDLSGAAGVGSKAVWALGEAGIRLRNRQYSTQVPARVQLGLKPIEELGLMADGEVLWSLGNGEAPDFFVDEFGKGPLVVDNARFVKVGGGLFTTPFRQAIKRRSSASWLREAGVSLRGWHVPWGERTSASTTFSLSVFWQGELSLW